jgi:thiamine-monophosphate kinase
VALAPVIRRYATASLDVSDGLVADFAHICKQSGVGGEIDAGAVPLSAGAKALVAADPTALKTVLTGGEDFEILATVAEPDSDAFAEAAAEAGVPVTRIGRVTEGSGPPVVVGRDGPIRLDQLGYTHF